MKTTKLTFDQTGWLEINYIQTDGDTPLTLQSTSYHPTQLDLIQADCATHGVTIGGDDATAVAEWVADYVPPPPPVLTPEQLREQAKRERAIAVENIKVTTAAGNTFDGDETSQTRMSRAILVLSTGFATTVPWVLADNTVIQASAAELTEALALAGQAQAAIWVIE